MAWTPRRGRRAAQARPNEASRGGQVCGARTGAGEPAPLRPPLGEAILDPGAVRGQLRGGEAPGAGRADHCAPQRRCGPRAAPLPVALELHAGARAGARAGLSRLRVGEARPPSDARAWPGPPTPGAGLGNGRGRGRALSPGHTEPFPVNCEGGCWSHLAEDPKHGAVLSVLHGSGLMSPQDPASAGAAR